MITTHEGLSIGEAAARLNLSEDTLRYYEREGLTPPVERAGSGHRRYTEQDLLWFVFVIKMRATGMSIETLRRYAELTRAGESTAAQRREMLEEHGRTIEARIAEMQAALDHVKMKIARLGAGTSQKC